MGDGPYDSDDPIVERLGRSSGRIDFGSLRIPIPARAQLQVEKGNGDLLRAVHVLVPSGRVSLSALAAPRTNPLWRGLAGEIGDSLAGDGARVRAEWGEWGREVEAASNGAISRFIGVDGPRWMLYGVATGPADGAEDLAVVLRDMVRGTVVFRGPDPLPVKTVLPLRLPEELEERVEQAREISREDAREGFRPPARNGAGPVPAVPPAREPMPPRRPLTTAPPARVPGHPPTLRPGHEAPAHPAARPAARAAGAAIGSLGRPVGARPSSALPPVPAATAGGESGMSAVESTWSLANPVVDAAEVAQQPAWASLSAAPSFWPHEHYRPAEPAHPAGEFGAGRSGGAVIGTGSYGTGSYGTGSYGTGSYDAGPYGTGSYDAGPYGGGRNGAGPYGDGSNGAGSNGAGRYGAGSLGSGSYASDAFGSSSSGAGSFGAVSSGTAAEAATAFGSGADGGYPSPLAGFDLTGPGDDQTRSPLERAILAEMASAADQPQPVAAGPHEPPVTPGTSGAQRPGDTGGHSWAGSDDDLLSSTDGLHAVLLDDSAATRGWAAGAGRRGRRRAE